MLDGTKRWCVNYYDRPNDYMLHAVFGSNASDTYAQMLIYLLENNLLSV